jgi:hypothetical protein
MSGLYVLLFKVTEVKVKNVTVSWHISLLFADQKNMAANQHKVSHVAPGEQWTLDHFICHLLTV